MPIKTSAFSSAPLRALHPRSFVSLLALLSLSACGGSADDVVVTKEQTHIVESRIANFKDMGAAFKGISDELKVDRPTSTTTLYSIKALASFGPQVKNWFPDGTGPETGLKTGAKAEIWEQPEAFATSVTEFETAVADLSAAGRASDPDLIKAGFVKVGGTCKGCHDTFREED